MINLSHAPLSVEEAEEREEALAEVMDPMFLFSRAEGEGEGEGDVDGDGDVEGDVQVEDGVVPRAEANGVDDALFGEDTVQVDT